MFLTEGIPVDSLSKMIRNKNIPTTKIYNKITSQKISTNMDLVSHKFKSVKDAFMLLFFSNRD